MLLTMTIATAAEPEVVRLENVPDANAISAKEPVRKSFSAKQAAYYLDTASLNWQKNRKCVTCHTNMAYLMVRPALDSTLKNSGEVREFFESYYLSRWKAGKRMPPTGAYEPVVVSTALAFNDTQTTGKLSRVTRNTFDVMWSTQRDGGGWDWAKCGWAPMEIDDHYGVTLAALAVGIAPENYANTETAKAGLQKIREYLKNNPPRSLHHRIMITWAALRVDDLMSSQMQADVLEQVLNKQLPDGGWSTPALLRDWKEFVRKDGKEHDINHSDAYATGLAIVLARELGIPATDDRLKNGITWLKANQRESGKWFTRSPSKDSRHYFTNFGSAFAILALQACGELPGWPFSNAPQ
jgi:squalene-hopene/tetraprenyl-beta-curcumene cyclase